MDRHDKLKRLKDEVSRLFYDKVNENEAYNQLQANPNFGSIVKRSDIHSLYEHLDKKNKIAAEDKKQIEAWKKEEKQMLANMECMKDYHQNSSKYLLYDDKIYGKVEMYMSIWQSRFFVIIREYPNLHKFDVLDMFQNVSKLFTIQARGYFFRLHILAFPFVLLHEYYGPFDYFRLLRFDFENDLLQVVQSFEYKSDNFIFVDQFNSSKFILKEKRGEMHNCKFFNGKIQIGNKFDIEWQPNYLTTSYFNEHLYSLKFERDDSIVKILTYNLELKESKSFELSPFPEHLPKNSLLRRCGWVKDHVFTLVRFDLTNEYGIAVAEPETRKWTFIEFVTKIQIKCIQFVDGQNLIIYANRNEEPCKQEIYKITMRKPDLLRNKAWVTLVKKFKKDVKIDDPYAEARKFLPLNSEIHEFIFFED